MDDGDLIALSATAKAFAHLPRLLPEVWTGPPPHQPTHALTLHLTHPPTQVHIDLLNSDVKYPARFVQGLALPPTRDMLTVLHLYNINSVRAHLHWHAFTIFSSINLTPLLLNPHDRLSFATN